MIKVSVIITAFGKPHFLEKAIKSVFNQTLKNIELIVVDDNTPGTEARLLTEEIVNRLSNSDIDIVYLKHQHNKNGAAARNTGIVVAKGEYLSFLDSDDEYFSERLEKCSVKMEQCSDEIAGVYTGCEFRKNGKKYSSHKKVQSGNFMVATLACVFKFGTGSNLFIRKTVVDQLSGFDERFLRHQDYEFLVRLFKEYSLQGISDVLVIKNNENTNLPDVHKMIDIKSQYLLKYESIIQSLPDDSQRFIYHSQYIAIAEQAIRAKHFAVANNYYLRAAQHGSLSVRNRVRRLIFSIINLINND
jgi:glycosyltransferase involved in cell wall biosynthesis